MVWRIAMHEDGYTPLERDAVAESEEAGFGKRRVR
jgi:hypothetical protein